jgi:hypothetical protein
MATYSAVPSLLVRDVLVKLLPPVATAPPIIVLRPAPAAVSVASDTPALLRSLRLSSFILFLLSSLEDSCALTRVFDEPPKLLIQPFSAVYIGNSPAYSWKIHPDFS